MGGIWLLAGMWLVGGDPFQVLEDRANIQQTSSTVQRPTSQGIPPVRVEARSEMGKRFRLVEAIYLLDGAQIAHLKAPPNQELNIAAQALEIAMPGGQHALTVVLVYRGRNVGLFSYLENFRFRTVATYAFYLEKAEGRPSIKVLARERPGFFVAVENKPMLEISAPFGFGVTPMAGVSHGTEVTVVK